MKELNWRLLLLGAILCAVASAATPYVTLKLGMSVDLTMGGMFLAAAVLGRYAKTSKHLAVELNIIQTMIGMVSGIGFMVVIMAAFFYIQNVFGRDIGFNPTWWQLFLWLLVSANLGVFMGILPRRAILNDATLPWPTAKATLSVAQTLTDPAANETTKRRRDVLMVSTAVSGFLTFLRDGLGVITPMVGNAALKMSFGLEFAAIGIGMLVPLSVGLSGLLGAWILNAFGETVAKFSALTGTAPQHWDRCETVLDSVGGLHGSERAQAVTFLTDHCGSAMEYVDAHSHFKLLVQWMMWPATAMMIAAALTSVIVPVVRNLLARRNARSQAAAMAAAEAASEADESIPTWWPVAGITVSALLTVWMTSAWFDMPWLEVVLAVAIQPLLIVAGLRVLGITGSGPVSLMTNATQFLFGLIWPAQIRSNLGAAYVSANPQASSENVVPAFWVARRLGGRFRTLVIAQLIIAPIGALLTPFMFSLLEQTYGIGLDEGQLSAPTGLKIASLAIVMERGLSALPHGALTASIAAAVIGILFELLLAVRKRNKDGGETTRFWWVPIPSALGFALILPPSLTIGTAFGSMVSAVWKRFSQQEGGVHDLYLAPVASGLIAGEAMVGSILLPALVAIVSLLTS